MVLLLHLLFQVMPMGTSLLFHGTEAVPFDGVSQTFHLFPNLFAGPAPGRGHTRSKFRDSPVIVRSAARLRVMNSAPSRREAAGEVHDAVENAGGAPRPIFTPM